MTISSVLSWVIPLLSFAGSAAWTPSVASEIELCLISENNTWHAKIVSKWQIPTEALRDVEGTCRNYDFARTCAAVEFSQTLCGSLSAHIFDLDEPQSKIFHEDLDGNSIDPPKITGFIQIVVSPDLIIPEEELTATVDQINRQLEHDYCDISFKLLGTPQTLPDAYRNKLYNTQGLLESAAHYPGKFKLVPQINFCGSNDKTMILGDAGSDEISECTYTKYNSTIVRDIGNKLRWILLLRGYAHLSGLSDHTSDKLKYTVSDPELLIPYSKLLDGDLTAFKITREQCVYLARYAKKDAAVNGWK